CLFEIFLLPSLARIFPLSPAPSLPEAINETKSTEKKDAVHSRIEHSRSLAAPSSPEPRRIQRSSPSRYRTQMSSKGLDALLALPSTSLLPRDGEDGAVDARSAATLGDLRDAKATVYDFWTTRCTNCPAALDALDSIAFARPSVAFVAVNIDDSGAARELVSQAASEGRWTRRGKSRVFSLAHVHLEEDEKERAKDILGMRTVPFYVVVGEDGKVLRHGSAKTLPLKTVESLDSALLPPPAGAGSATAREGRYGEGQQDENDAAAANAATPPGDETAAAGSPTAEEAPRGKATPSPRMECVGDVCKLIRKPKAAAAAAAAAAPQGQATGETAAEATVAATPGPAAASAAPTPSPAGVECDGGVCKLVRRPKKTAEQESKDDSVAAVAEASTAAAAVPAARTMECAGGVCKLVRKPKRGAEEQPAVSERKEEASESPLVVGDAMPSLQVVPIDGGSATTLDDVRARGPAVLDFWTTRCVRCPAALDALEGLAAAAAAAATDDPATYISVNLDSLEGAREMVFQG
ncbi:unnamed protein product, partial [Ectocarpus sp. 4 AP-2014]